MKAKYPPTTGIGRYDTASASLKCPIAISTSPNVAVPKQRSASVVDKISSCVCPSCCILSAIVFAIVDKKIRPASCTVPIANGNDENIKNPNWWTRDEKMRSLDNAFI